MGILHMNAVQWMLYYPPISNLIESSGLMKKIDTDCKQESEHI